MILYTSLQWLWYEPEFELTKYIPYLALMGEVWDEFCENLGEIRRCYNGTALYYRKHQTIYVSNY